MFITWPLYEALQLVGAHEEVEVGAGDGGHLLRTRRGLLASCVLSCGPSWLLGSCGSSCCCWGRLLGCCCSSYCWLGSSTLGQQLGAGVLGVGKLLLNLQNIV